MNRRTALALPSGRATCGTTTASPMVLTPRKWPEEAQSDLATTTTGPDGQIGTSNSDGQHADTPRLAD